MKDKTIKLNDVTELDKKPNSSNVILLNNILREIDTLREHYLNSLRVSEEHNLNYSVAACQNKLDVLLLLRNRIKKSYGGVE